MYCGDYFVGGLKKDIKKALKSTDAAKIQKALDREQAKIDKAPGSKKVAKRVAYVSQLQAQLAKASPSAPVAVTPTTPIASNTPEIPIASYAPPNSFSSGGGGGGGGIPMDQGAPPNDIAPAATDSDNPLMTYLPYALGAAAILFFMMKKRR